MKSKLAPILKPIVHFLVDQTTVRLATWASILVFFTVLVLKALSIHGSMILGLAILGGVLLTPFMLQECFVIYRKRKHRTSSEKVKRIRFDPSPTGISFEESDAPEISIVIPIFGQLRYTLTCLASLSFAGKGFNHFEIIVVDDNSQDNSFKELSKISGLRVIRNEAESGFGGACNLGAKNARGATLLFLNNDTEVATDFFQHISDFMDDPSVGAVGAMLTYPDKVIQEVAALSIQMVPHLDSAMEETRTTICTTFGAMSTTVRRLAW